MDRHDELDVSGTDLLELEQHWIAAETEADMARDLAERAAEAAAELQRTAPDQPEIKVLIGKAESYQERRARAEADAVAAFDRLWSAKDRF
ncbi:MAG: hypothetical protein AAFY27_13075 [Pseudomonadota bacterium]